MMLLAMLLTTPALPLRPAPGLRASAPKMLMNGMQNRRYDHLRQSNYRYGNQGMNMYSQPWHQQVNSMEADSFRNGPSRRMSDTFDQSFVHDGTAGMQNMQYRQQQYGPMRNGYQNYGTTSRYNNQYGNGYGMNNNQYYGNGYGNGYGTGYGNGLGGSRYGTTFRGYQDNRNNQYNSNYNQRSPFLNDGNNRQYGYQNYGNGRQRYSQYGNGYSQYGNGYGNGYNTNGVYGTQRYNQYGNGYGTGYGNNRYGSYGNSRYNSYGNYNNYNNNYYGNNGYSNLQSRAYQYEPMVNGGTTQSRYSGYGPTYGNNNYNNYNSYNNGMYNNNMMYNQQQYGPWRSGYNGVSSYDGTDATRNNRYGRGMTYGQAYSTRGPFIHDDSKGKAVMEWRQQMYRNDRYGSSGYSGYNRYNNGNNWNNGYNSYNTGYGNSNGNYGYY